MNQPEIHNLRGASLPITHRLLSINDPEAQPRPVSAMMVVPADFTVREVLMAMQDAGYTMTVECKILTYDLSGILPGLPYEPYIKHSW